ncbi:MAG: FAD-dependent oxidoreductase [Alphaproteobacteria bacterium]|nr:MAG: FAD-dependent oxidoreductase [Alphaproteobacteria bacterium]
MGIDTDIVVAGGGIVGMTLALALRRAGFAVTLCDALPVPARADAQFDGRAYAVAAAGRRMLDALGVWQAVAPAAQAMTDILVGDSRPGEAAPPLLHFDHRESDSGPFAWMVEDHVLRIALLSALEAAGITHLAPVTIAGQEAGPEAVAVALADGRRLRARLLAACDGRDSAIAARAGIGRVGRGYRQRGLVCALAHERPHRGIARQIFLPGGPFAILPLTGNRVSLVWTETEALAAALDALPDADYLAEIRRRIGDPLGAVRLIGRRWSYPLAFSLARRYFADRVVLAGDAAHVIHPLAGQGLNLGLADVAALTEVLAEAARRGEDIGAPSVLARYQAWRRFDAGLMGLACDGFNSSFSNDNPLLRALRDAGLGLAGAPLAARRFFMGLAAGETGDVPRLMRGEPV